VTQSCKPPAWLEYLTKPRKPPSARLRSLGSPDMPKEFVFPLPMLPPHESRLMEIGMTPTLSPRKCP